MASKLTWLIEHGLTVVRQSDKGFSPVIDPYGYIVAQGDHVGREHVMMTAEVPVMPAYIVYPVLGDVVRQKLVVGLVLAILAAITRRV